MRRTTIAALFAGLAAAAAPAAAQKDVGDPLEHFFATKAVDGQGRHLDDPVARLVDDFNADGMPDVALWQARELVGPRGGPVFLYLMRKDGRFAAAGSILADPDTLFRIVTAPGGGARLLVCPFGAVTRGYEVNGTIVTELPQGGLPRECGADGVPAVERLDMARYRANGMQAWIKR
jgi:hypothetical protein